MIYRIALHFAREEYDESDNAQTAKDDLYRLRQESPADQYVILRDDREIAEAELEDDVALQGDFKKTSKVPAGYRSGKWGGTHDLGISPEDAPTSVWKPPNPEEEYE